MTAERCPSRLKEHDWKSCRRATVSRVRIPPSPPSTSCCLTQRVLAILPLTVLLPLALLLLVLPIFLAACGGSGSSDLTGAEGPETTSSVAAVVPSSTSSTVPDVGLSEDSHRYMEELNVTVRGALYPQTAPVGPNAARGMDLWGRSPVSDVEDQVPRNGNP